MNAADRASQRLDALNQERREIEADVLAAATAQAEARDLSGALVWAAGEGWHPGVVGIVASRLKEAYERPAVVIGLTGAEGKGSGRSVAGVDLGASVAALTAEGMLLKDGRHKIATGLNNEKARLEETKKRNDALLARQGAGRDTPRELKLSGMLTPAGATVDLLEQLEAAGPFGAGAPQPRFAIADARISHLKRAGESHLSVSLTGPGGGRLQAIAFRAFEGPMGSALEAHDGRAVHLAGRLEIDDWGGRRKAKLRIEDAAYATA